MTLKELKTAYNVLTELDIDVPREILIHIANEIRDMESRIASRRMSRMTEEQLIALSERKRNILRVNTDDGRLIQKKTSEKTFRTALLELDLMRAYKQNIMLRNKKVILHDPTLLRQRIKGYVLLKPGFFVIAKSTTEEKCRVLTTLDEALQLNWEVKTL